MDSVILFTAEEGWILCPICKKKLLRVEHETEAENLEEEGYTILRYWNYLPEDFPEYVLYKYLIPIPLK